MTYDNYGNIKTKNGIAYTYGNSSWKDLLTKVGNQEISYDNQGNPINYLGHILTWEKGRQLKSFDNIQYSYNANGIRTGKTVNGVAHNYILGGTKILRETWGENVLIPLYDNEDGVCGIEYNGKAFYFVRNQQNDVIAITDKDGETVARYTYDAWGVCTIAEDTSEVGIAAVNPYRYRSYYYDTEIGMYYLWSRFYDPVICRFINSDDPTYIQATEKSTHHTLFAYCENSPIINTDETGFANLAPIGYGFQIEFNVSIGTAGIEFIWYTSSSIRQGRAWYIPYVYLYGGFSIGSDITSIVSKITKNPALLFNPKNLTKVSFSISIFAIWGYSGKFTRPRDYEGWFTGVSVTVWNVKAYTAWGSSCLVVGVGISTSKFAASSGQTRYKLSSRIFNGMSGVYNNVSKKGKTLKKK